MSLLIWRRVERLDRQSHTIPDLTCPCIWSCLDQDIRVLHGDNKLSGCGFSSPIIPDASAECPRRSEHTFSTPTVCSPATAGTMKVTQKYITSSIHLFLNRQDLWYTDTCASLEICRFISSVCTERVSIVPQPFRQCCSCTIHTARSLAAGGRYVNVDDHLQAPLRLRKP